ncbi:TOG array regulator of axonemal microtubules protein 1 isoform X2 [Lathamus discolor]|uniref:TOG array regulator of axonemal microtubules protein 1 isoform X2 n=1 Tax=Lathamus discolor TaxID=678569 RepID=UPI0032B7C640
MAAALTLRPCARAMEEPPDPGIPPRLGPERAGRAGEGNAAAAAAVELPWGLRPVLCGKALRERRRGSGCFPCPPVSCRGAGELCPSLAPQLGGPASRGRREEGPGAEPLPPTGSQQPVGEDTAPLPSAEPGGSGLRFGLLAPELHARLLDQEDYRNRMQAVEDLKRVVEDASQAAVTSVPAPSILGFISLLCTLLGDFNFKVVLGALEVIYLLALRLDNQVKAFLTPLFSAATKVLGNSKLAVRQGYSRLLRWLMKAVGPQQVLNLLLRQEYRQHKNSKVREEVVNMCIVALLTHPSEELDLAKLAFELAPALVDNKHRVRHAAMEAFAVLASAMGPGKITLLFKAVDAMELKDNGDGLMHAVQARLARKILPKLADQGFVEYAVPLPSSCHNRASCLPPGADTEWLLMCDRTQSAHSYCGYEVRVDALQYSSSHSAGANQVACSRKVSSAYKRKNKLPWESEHAEDKEVASGVKIPVTKGVEQFPTSSDLLHFPELRPSQGVPVSDELHFSRKRTSGNFIQNSIDFNSEHSSVCAGPVGSHQLQISGKCGTLGYTQTRGKSGSVESDLQFLGLSNCQQDKGGTSLNFSSKTQRSFCNQAENTMPFQGPNASQGTFTLPTCPLSSPRNSPKHMSSPVGSSRKPQGENLQEKHAPLQLKPTLVRQPAPCRGLNGTKPIPPIPRLLPDKIELNVTKWRNEDCKDMRLNKADGKLAAADLSELNVDGEEVDREEMKNSLRSVRNSAAKKRAELSSNISGLESPDSALKLDLSVGSPSHTSCPSVDAYSESGVYSQESLTSPMSTVPHRRRIMSDNFLLLGRKSQTARTFSARNRDPNVAEHNTSTARPVFGDNVSTVGQHLNCGNMCGDYEDKKQELSRTTFQSQNMEHQRNYKHSKGLEEAASSFPQTNNLDFISQSVPSQDGVVIVGKGVSENPPAQVYGQSLACIANGDDQALNETSEQSSGTCGRSMQQNRASHFYIENEEENRVTLSKSTHDKMKRNRRKEKECNHKEYQDVTDLGGKDQKPWENLEPNGPEIIMTAEKNVALNPSLKITSSFKNTKRPALLQSDEVSLRAQGYYKDKSQVTGLMDTSELWPFSKPETALTEALTLLAGDDWEKKMEGLNFIRCLSAYHATILTAKLHETSMAVAQEVKNLRSGVSRAAVVCLGDLFTYLKKSMDQELDYTVKILLHKAGESNTFIREEVDKALKAMVNNVTPARALCSLIDGGQSHLNSAVRRCTAQHLSDIVECMGLDRILSGSKVVADRLFPAIVRFTQDSSQQTRYYGRKMLFSMMTHPDFDKTIEKYVLTKDLPYIRESVINLREKGLGGLPSDTPSAKRRHSHTSTVGRLRDTINITDRDTTEASEVVRKTAPRNLLENEEYVKDIIGLLNAKDFRDRIRGIKQLLFDAENNQGFVVANIVKIFDAFKCRLNDLNSKVNQIALETMHQIIPLLKDNLSPVINMLIPAMVDNNLNSRNPGIYAAAKKVIQALCQHVDNYLLLQPFCTKAQFLNGKAKQDITEKLADIVTELYPRKPKSVEQKVLVVLWHLLGNMTNSGSLPGTGGNIRTATAKLSKALFARMGPSLLTRAAAQSPHIKKTLKELLETQS